MPMMISPTAVDWPPRLASAPPIRPARMMRVSSSSVKNSMSSFLCVPVTAAAVPGMFISDHPAVDGDDLSGDVRGLLGGEKTHQARHFLGASGALHGHEVGDGGGIEGGIAHAGRNDARSEEHTSELQS